MQALTSMMVVAEFHGELVAVCMPVLLAMLVVFDEAQDFRRYPRDEQRAMLRLLANARHSAPDLAGKSGTSENFDLTVLEEAAYVRDLMPAVTAETIGDRLIEARIRRGLTRLQLAHRAGYSSETTLRRYEDGDVIHPREDIAKRFADALGCDPVWLLTGRGEPGWDPGWR